MDPDSVITISTCFKLNIAEIHYVLLAFSRHKCFDKLKYSCVCSTEKLSSLTLCVRVLSPREAENLSLYPTWASNSSGVHLQRGTNIFSNLTNKNWVDWTFLKMWAGSIVVVLWFVVVVFLSLFFFFSLFFKQPVFFLLITPLSSSCERLPVHPLVILERMPEAPSSKIYLYKNSQVVIALPWCV